MKTCEGKMKRILGLTVLGVLLASCSAKSAKVEAPTSAEEAGVASIESMSLEVALDMTRLVVLASQPLRYNSFKLENPERIVVDVVGASLASSFPRNLAGQGELVSGVEISSFQDEASNLVRMEISLLKASSYLIAAESNGLVLRIFPAASSDGLGVIAREEAAPALPAEEEVSVDSLRMSEESLSASENIPSVDSISELDVPVPMPEDVAEIEAEVVTATMPELESQTETQVEEKVELKLTMTEEALPAPILSQEIMTGEFTEGTSLLGGLGSKVYSGNRVSLEFQDANIQDVLRLIAEVSKLNLILSDEVKGQVTLKLIDVPWDQALDILLTSRGLDKVQQGNILRVAPIESLKKEREMALANDKAAKQLEPLRLKLFNVNYATSGEMATRIKNLLSERGSVDMDTRTNTLIVEDIAENLSRVENLIKVLDSQTPQVRIESRIVQANDNFTRSLGIQWGPTLRLDDVNQKQLGWQFPRTINIGTQPGAGVGFSAPAPSALSEFAVDALASGTGASSIGFRLGSISDIFNLDLRLSYAENEQMARIVSRPSVTVLDNKTARIIQGTKIPFLSSSSEGTNVQFQEAGIEISVTPQVTNDGAVILKVSTKSNEPASQSVGGNPIISIREADTEMLIKSGRTAVLGGVFKTSETEGRNGVPGLKDVPVLGWLFRGQSRSTSREEMLIFITPYVLTDVREPSSAPLSSSRLEP